MDRITLTIDGREVEAASGATVLEASLAGDVYVPHLCHHPDLAPVGDCRLCLVEVEGEEGLQASCLTPAADGMVVRTSSPLVEGVRRLATELLLSDHPPECVGCGKYLSCELQSVKQFTGITEELGVRRRMKPIPVDASNPLFVHDFARCIGCGLCVRACGELRGVGALRLVHRNGDLRVGYSIGSTLAEAGCRFCGACVEVCPTGSIRDREEIGRGRKRRQALVPCKYACPAEIDVPRYVRLIARGRYAEAHAVIREKVPFPEVLGYLCDHPCETVCRRGDVNEPVAIRDLKRVAVENDTEQLWKQSARREPPTGKRVAVVGSGPAGLTAGYYLAKLGHAVTVFEELPLAGGMMSVGAPEYRLPRPVVEREIREIEAAGVEIRTGARVESPPALLAEGYDAALVAVGAHAGTRLPLPGAELEGVLVGLSLLRDVSLGNGVGVGKRVVVLGGGNVAFDCARVARRVGAEEVRLVCLEAREAMLADREEIEQGEEEGVLVYPSRAFTSIVGESGRVTGVECVEVSSFQLGEDGALSLAAVEGSEHVLPADTVVFAVGQRPRLPDAFGLERDGRSLIAVDEHTLGTSVAGVFAIGDAVAGTGSVIKAIAAGRRGASAVDSYLGGSGDIEERLAPVEELDPWLGPGEGFATTRRRTGALAPADERVESFCQVVATLDPDAGAAEAARCLQCDLRLTVAPVRFWGEFQSR